MEEGRRGRAPQPISLRQLEAADALLRSAVEVEVVRVPCSDARLDHRVDRRVQRPAVRHGERSADAVELVRAPLVVLRALEVGQHLVVAPALGPVCRPAVEVGAVAARVDHRVDRAAATDDLPTRQEQSPAVEAWLRVAEQVPVDARLEQHRESDRHGDLRPAVVAACLEQRHLDIGILAEPRSEHAACRSSTDDHVVVQRASLVVRQPDSTQGPRARSNITRTPPARPRRPLQHPVDTHPRAAD